MTFDRLRSLWIPRAIAAILVGFAALSCGGDSTAPHVAVATVDLTPPTKALLVSQTVQLSASEKDASGNVLTGRTVTWGTSDATVATVSATGLATAVAVGTATIIATSEGKSNTAALTVSAVPVSAVVIGVASSTISIGDTETLTAMTVDSAGHALAGHTVAWSSTLPAIATVSATGLVTGVANGTTGIVATSEGKVDTAAITVASCTSLELAVGAVHTLTAAERSTLCLDGGASVTEYALVPFNNSTVASSSTPVHFAGTNTSDVGGPLASRVGAGVSADLRMPRIALDRSFEASFRARERRDLAAAFGHMRGSPRSLVPGGPSYLLGVPTTPIVDSVYQLNINVQGNTCTDAKVLHPARVVVVLPHTIVLIDTLAPTGGYANADMIAFGQSFDTLGYALDTTNFGAPTDIDGNGRVAILFTPGVNVIPAPPGSLIGGLQASRDLAPASSCTASNTGEMFYMPVPDPNQTINGNYTNVPFLKSTVLPTLVHEFQHLINAGRRAYVNNASSFEEVWLNEGLSHIAEELLYYRISGNSPGTNIDYAKITSTQAQLDAINGFQINNLGRLKFYMASPEVNSPYSDVDGLAMRGAIWQLLRYSRDLKGGTDRSVWFPLVNSTTSGQANFNAVFGSITSLTHDWSIAQIADDAGLDLLPKYTNLSWNFRSLEPHLNVIAGTPTFPLLTHALVSSPVDVTLNGGGSAYVRFRVAASVTAKISSTSSGAALPSNVDVTVIRMQ